MKLKKVLVVTDDDGHWYIIPKELKEQFNQELRNGEEDEYEVFNDLFSQFRTGGDINNKLYAEI